MESIFERFITGPIESFLERTAMFLPDLFSALFILLIGLTVAWLARFLLSRFFKILKLDSFSERSGVSRIISKGGIRESFSIITARFISWLIFFVFAIISLSNLNVPAIDRLLEKLLLYLPNILVAFVILIVGYLLGNFLGRTALIASVNAGLKVSRFVGWSVKLSVFLFSLSIALEQLGIGKDTVIIAFAIIFGGTVLALSISFGLGGRDIAKSYLESKLLKGDKENDIGHI